MFRFLSRTCSRCFRAGYQFCFPSNGVRRAANPVSTHSVRHTREHTQQVVESTLARLPYQTCVPISAPPALHALAATLLVLGARDARAREFVRCRERSHAAPRVERGVRRAHDAQRHFGWQHGAQRTLDTLREARQRRGRAGEKYILQAGIGARLRSRRHATHLHKPPAYVEREHAENVLKYLAESRRIDARERGREPGLARTPEFCREVYACSACGMSACGIDNERAGTHPQRPRPHIPAGKPSAARCVPMRVRRASARGRTSGRARAASPQRMRVV
jgi:hypothetical protein